MKVREPEDWTPGMRRVVRLSKILAAKLMGVETLHVKIATEVTWPYAATYGRVGQYTGSLVFNLGRLGHRWFDEPLGRQHLRLLIHEFGHHYSSNHLSEEYHDALCNLGARAALIGVRQIITGIENPKGSP
jgi:hypothetical protein